MFSKHSLENIKAIKPSIPSLYIDERGDDFSIIIYARTKDKNPKFLCIGSMSLEKQENIGAVSVYRNSGYSGAYPGFGELLYSIAMHECQTRNALLVADDRGLSEAAEKLYHKLDVADNVVNNILDNGNTGYSMRFSNKDIILFDYLCRNNSHNNLTAPDIASLKDQAYDLGEHLLPENNIIDRKELQKDFENGYPQLISEGNILVDEHSAPPK